jgi:sugar lactone lactonase YvrE
MSPGGFLYVADTRNGRVRRIDPKRGTVESRAWDLVRPVAVAVDDRGTLYVAQQDGPIFVFAGDGTISKIERRLGWIGSWGQSTGMAIGPDGALYLGNDSEQEHGIDRFEGRGKHSRIVGDLYRPHGLAFDSVGNLYAAEPLRNMIVRVLPDGKTIPVAGAKPGFWNVTPFADGPRDVARLYGPHGIAFDARGRLYVADTVNHRIRRVELDGSVVTLAGSGRKGFANGPASQAELNEPRGVAIGPDGTIYVLDSGNHCVRAIVPT